MAFGVLLVDWFVLKSGKLDGTGFDGNRNGIACGPSMELRI